MKDYSKLSKEQLIDELILLGGENLILTSLNEKQAKQLDLYDVGISFCFDDDEISDLVTDWINGFKNITSRTKTNLEFGFQEGIYKMKEVLRK